MSSIYLVQGVNAYKAAQEMEPNWWLYFQMWKMKSGDYTDTKDEWEMYLDPYENNWSPTSATGELVDILVDAVFPFVEARLKTTEGDKSVAVVNTAHLGADADMRRIAYLQVYSREWNSKRCFRSATIKMEVMKSVLTTTSYHLWYGYNDEPLPAGHRLEYGCKDGQELNLYPMQILERLKSGKDTEHGPFRLQVRRFLETVE